MSRDDPTADTGPAATDVSPARYLDALLIEMDRWMMPDLVTDRARLLYDAMRRVMVTLTGRMEKLPAPDELGIDPVGPGVSDGADGVIEEGRRIDALIIAQDTRIAAIDVPQVHHGVSVDAVQTALRIAGEPDATVRSMRVVVGGRSKETVLLEIAGAKDWPATLVMRRDLRVGSLGTTVVDEFALLDFLHGRGLAVPRPYHLSLTGDGLGTAFLLLEAMPGQATGQLLAAPNSRAKVLAAARILATIHAVPVAAVQPLLGKTAADRAALIAEIDSFAQIWAQQARMASPTMVAVFAWLKANVAGIADRNCFIHADYGFHNILFDGDKVSALLDWELARIGHPAEDLGYIKYAAQGVIGWDEFMAAYVAAGGRAVSWREISFYALFSKVWLLTKIFKSRELFETGQMDDILKADSVSYWLPRIIHSLSLEMREIANSRFG